MDISNYIARMKIIYSSFLNYAINENNTSEDFKEFLKLINSNLFGTNLDELRSLLHMIHKLSNHHKQTPIFNKNIQDILLHFSDQIKQTLSNSEIFKIFKRNKFILSFLFDNKIINVDKEIIHLLLSQYRREECNFFYPEIKPFLNDIAGKYKIILLDNSILDDPNFLKKRQEGVNDSCICQLIRQDLLDEFKSYLKEQELDYDELVPTSIFETNLFLKREEPSFIEYAAFYKSTKIFEFLLDKVELEPSMWLYAIHGQNKELIELLKEKKINPKDLTYKECFLNAIKCHHNELAKTFSIKENDDKILQKIFCNYNFEFFPNVLNDYKLIFDFSCMYDYVSIVKILLQTNKIELRPMLENEHKITSKSFSMKFQKKN